MNNAICQSIRTLSWSCWNTKRCEVVHRRLIECAMNVECWCWRSKNLHLAAIIVHCTHSVTIIIIIILTFKTYTFMHTKILKWKYLFLIILDYRYEICQELPKCRAHTHKHIQTQIIFCSALQKSWGWKCICEKRWATSARTLSQTQHKNESRAHTQTLPTPRVFTAQWCTHRPA